MSTEIPFYRSFRSFMNHDERLLNLKREISRFDVETRAIHLITVNGVLASWAMPNTIRFFPSPRLSPMMTATNFGKSTPKTHTHTCLCDFIFVQPDERGWHGYTRMCLYFPFHFHIKFNCSVDKFMRKMNHIFNRQRFDPLNLILNMNGKNIGCGKNHDGECKWGRGTWDIDTVTWCALHVNSHRCRFVRQSRGNQQSCLMSLPRVMIL